MHRAIANFRTRSKKDKGRRIQEEGMKGFPQGKKKDSGRRNFWRSLTIKKNSRILPNAF
jgi:hypothetical protein